MPPADGRDALASLSGIWVLTENEQDSLLLCASSSPLSEKNISLETLLKIGAITATVIVVVVFTALEWADYNDGRSAERIEAMRVAANGAVRRDEIQSRVDALAVDGCQARAAQLMSLHARIPLKSLKDIPQELRNDMVLCVERGILRGYVRGSLTDAGLMGIFAKQANTL